MPLQQRQVEPSSPLPPVKNLRTYFKNRTPLVAGAGLLGALSTAGSQAAPSHDIEGIKGALSSSNSLKVRHFVWEPSAGVFFNYFVGRPLLFEAQNLVDSGAKRDIYRAFARLSPEGKVLDFGSPLNLTQTKSGDEQGLKAHGDIAVFGTSSKESPPSITLLHLNGEKQRHQHGPLHSLQLGLTRSLETGSWRGLDRSDILLKPGSSSPQLTVEVNQETLTISSGHSHTTLATSALFSPATAPWSGPGNGIFQHIYRQREPATWLHFAANSGRSLWGKESIAWLEGRVFSLKDSLQRLSYSITHSGPPLSVDAKSSFQETAPLPSTLKFSNSKEGAPPVWPPATIQLKDSSHHEDGIWKEVRRHVLPPTKEPLFYRSLLHPDSQRPDAELHLVAMDMRRLQLGIGAGYEDPRPDTGPPGSGQLPREDSLPQRVVATFNGAFKATHGRYGMKAEGRLLVRPVENAATIAVDAQGSAGFGSWHKEMSSKNLRSFRQNLDPLVSDGIVNPAQRKVWGEHLYGSVAVERTALCLHNSGQIIYAWATRATGKSLAHGLKLAGCVYAVHLDMNPGHCAFLFNRVESIDPLKAQGETLDSRMQVNPTRFIRWSPKDFFYLSLRPPLPVHKGVQWRKAPGQGPSPQDIPGIFLGNQAIGSLHIEFDRIDAGRVSFSLTPGRGEKRGRATTSLPAPEASPSIPASALIAWGLGHRTRGSRPGLVLDGEPLVPPDRKFATLAIGPHGTLSVLDAGSPTPEKTIQLVQLPVLAQQGTLNEKARELGGKKERAALCMDAHNNIYIARMVHDTPAPLAQALLHLGCSLVVSMDRGSHPPPLVQRKGVSLSVEGQPSPIQPDQTMLWGHDTTMKPLTYSF